MSDSTPPPPHRPRVLLAAMTGFLAVLCALLLPFAPVSVNEPTGSWPKDPARPEPTLLNLGKIYRVQDKFDQAIALYEAALATPGREYDVQLLNNARILHAREAYEDADDPAQRRHLLRLWLAAHHFSSVDEVLQGGIPKQVGATRSR